jgi:hypothetical protein
MSLFMTARIGLCDNALLQLRRGNVTWESTEEMYIDALTQALLTEVIAIHIDQVEKVVNCYYHLYGECTKGRLRVKDEACVYCLERALDDISFALCCDDS